MDSNFWNNIYQTKAKDAVSWFQETPKHSLEIISSLHLDKEAEIIDIGGGQSRLTEFLYHEGYKNLTVLDISNSALDKLKNTLNEVLPENKIETIATNIVEAKFTKQFDLWHDRAVFHFLTNKEDQKKYIELVSKSLKPNGHLLIATFSKNGPKKCSGLEICQYDKEDLALQFQNLKLIESNTEDHQTPFATTQNFTYCLFKN